MSLLTFNFCGVDAITDLDLIVNAIRMPITPEINESTQDVPGMIGKVFLGNSYGQKTFEIDITIKANDSYELAQKTHDLTNLVMTFGSGEYPMIFGNDSGYTYYGHFNSISIPEKIIQTSSWAKCTLSFACSDPRGYGEYISNDMVTNPVTITPNGSGECYPVFTCLPKKDVKKIAITDEDGNYVYIGADIDPDTGDTPIDKEPLVFHDACNTLANWTTVTQSTLTFSLDNGVVSGAMRSTPGSIRPALDSNGHQNFGPAVSNNWHGPMVLQWLPSSYSDFRIRVRLLNQQYYPRSEGKSEIYLMDSTGARIGKIGLKDNANDSVVLIQVQLGSTNGGTDLFYGGGNIKKGKVRTRTMKIGAGTKKVTEKKKTKTVQQWRTVKLDEDLTTGTFTDFYGYVELQKIGNKFTIKVMKLDKNSNPAWSKPITRTWTDSKKLYTKELAGVAFYAAKFDIVEDTASPVVIYANNAVTMCDVQVWNIIDGGNGVDETPTVVARSGDEIKINCEDRTIYKNGDVFMNKLYIGSEFPTMNGGLDSTYSFEPDLKDADWYLEYLPTTN